MCILEEKSSLVCWQPFALGVKNSFLNKENCSLQITSKVIFYLIEKKSLALQGQQKFFHDEKLTEKPLCAIFLLLALNNFAKGQVLCHVFIHCWVLSFSFFLLCLYHIYKIIETGVGSTHPDIWCMMTLPWCAIFSQKLWVENVSLAPFVLLAWYFGNIWKQEVQGALCSPNLNF